MFTQKCAQRMFASMCNKFQQQRNFGLSHYPYIPNKFVAGVKLDIQLSFETCLNENYLELQGTYLFGVIYKLYVCPKISSPIIFLCQLDVIVYCPTLFIFTVSSNGQVAVVIETHGGLKIGSELQVAYKRGSVVHWLSWCPLRAKIYLSISTYL